MTGVDLALYTLKFAIPSVFTLLFRVFGLGYINRRRLAMGLCIFAVYTAIVPPVLITVMGYGQFTHVVSLVMTTGAMSALIFSTDPPGKTILLVLICAQMNSVVAVPLNMVRHLLGLSYLTLDILLLVVCPIVYLVALRFWAKPLRLIADNLHGELIAPILIPIVSTVMIYAIPIYPARNFEFHPVYCTAMMLGVELAFFLYFYTLYRNMLQVSTLSTQKLDAELLKVSSAAMAERLRLLDEVTYQQSLEAHDRRHFNSMVLELLEQGQSEEAAAILRKQTESALSGGKRCCDNHAVGAIASYYAALAEKRGISTHIQLDIPTELPIDSLELAMALSNLFENAIHGCEALPKGAKKQIHLVCYHVERLILEISNPCTANTTLDKNGYPTARSTTHGIGTQSVLAFAKKYEAELFYRIEKGIFIVRLLV